MGTAWRRPNSTTIRLSEVTWRLPPLAFHLRRQPKTPWLDISEVLKHLHVPPKLSYTGIPEVMKASGGGLGAAEYHNFLAFGGNQPPVTTCFSSVRQPKNVRRRSSGVPASLHVPPNTSFTFFSEVLKASGGSLGTTEYHNFPAFGGNLSPATTCFLSAEAAENRSEA